MDKYNTFSRRFFAGFIDGIVLMPASLFGAYVKKSDEPYFIVLGLFVMYAIYFGYSVISHWHSGQTLGKKWMKVRVVDVSENKLLTGRQSFLRDSVYIILQTGTLFAIAYQVFELGHYPTETSIVTNTMRWLGTGWFLVEVLTMMTNDKRRAFHDLIADSVVINEEHWNNRNDRGQ